ncbi:MAG: Maf family protein [Oscillospiraceae bacterium]|jgi:septum formation protein|nr:Maf family protein [Oscillospiraceae bacterium]
MRGNTTENIILASASPRRRELIERLGLTFTVIPAKSELSAEPGEAPELSVVRIAKAKAEEIAAGSNDLRLIISADTIVVIDGKILGKPADADDAANMLAELSSKTHEVITAVTLLKNGGALEFTERTFVTFREITPAEINAYVSSGEPLDKAGAYGIQGLGGMFIERIDGDYYNVVGLPICALSIALKRFGIDLTENWS